MLKKWLGIDRLEAQFEEVKAERDKLAEKTQALQDELDSVKKSPKEIATEKGEPWVSVLETKFEDPKQPNRGYFELDWNEYFVKQLIEAGYSGRTDEEIVDMWFNDICYGVINGET